MLAGNKGEWSEIYVLLRLLADGKIYASDSKLNKLENVYFPIIKIIREENKGEIQEYATGEIISIYMNGSKVKELPATEFAMQSVQNCHKRLIYRNIFTLSELLLNEINSKTSKGAFSAEKKQNFMDKILRYTLSAPIAACQGLFNQNHLFFRPIFSETPSALFLSAYLALFQLHFH